MDDLEIKIAITYKVPKINLTLNGLLRGLDRDREAIMRAVVGKIFEALEGTILKPASSFRLKKTRFMYYYSLFRRFLGWRRLHRRIWAALFILLILASLVIPIPSRAAVVQAATAQGSIIDFAAERWNLANAKVTDVQGRKALMGTAFLKDDIFENGVIEVDFLATTDRARSYPGVIFRAAAEGAWERVYIRPHRQALYGDVIQYVPAWNGVDSWQLYSGFGATAPAAIPVNQWIHLKIEVLANQARIFLGSAPRPALVIPDLKRGRSKGGLGLMGPLDGTSYFSNFSFRAEEGLAFENMPYLDTSPGAVLDWRISKPCNLSAIDLEQTPEAQNLGEPAGNILVSHNEGRLFRITPSGGVTKILDLTVIGRNIADFDFIPEKNLVVFPTFADNRVLAYNIPIPR